MKGSKHTGGLRLKSITSCWNAAATYGRPSSLSSSRATTEIVISWKRPHSPTDCSEAWMDYRQFRMLAYWCAHDFPIWLRQESNVLPGFRLFACPLAIAKVVVKTSCNKTKTKTSSLETKTKTKISKWDIKQVGYTLLTNHLVKKRSNIGVASAVFQLFDLERSEVYKIAVLLVT